MSLRIPGFHRLRRDFPDTSARDTSCDCAVLQPHRGRNLGGLGSSPVARHYWGNHCLFSLPAGTKMFQFPAFASILIWIPVLQTDGLSHSEIHGSKVICTYPWLIAAYHVLHRLSEPRHPPYALVYFLSINKGSQSELLQAFKTFCLAHTFSCCQVKSLI